MPAGRVTWCLATFSSGRGADPGTVVGAQLGGELHMDQQCLTAQWSWRVSPEGRVYVVVIGCWCPVGPVLASLCSPGVCPKDVGGSCEQRRAKPLQLVFMWCSTPQPRAALFGKCSLLRCVCIVCPRETPQSLRCKASLGAGRAWWLRWLAVSLWDPAPAHPCVVCVPNLSAPSLLMCNGMDAC